MGSEVEDGIDEYDGELEVVVVVLEVFGVCGRFEDER